MLNSSATKDQLVRAMISNQKQWFEQCAEAEGGTVERYETTDVVITPSEAIISFPNLTNQNMIPTILAILDRFKDSNLQQIGCWVNSPFFPRDLGMRLMARGFEWGWQPHWMGMNLTSSLSDPKLLDEIVFSMDAGETETHEELPYFSTQSQAKMKYLREKYPTKFFHLMAKNNGVLIGHVVLHIHDGQDAIGGIYDMGVVNSCRHKGIGTALMLEIAITAKDQGCNHLMLNSAADDFYYSLGCKSLGKGQTWWLHNPAAKIGLLTTKLIRFAEAIGVGRLSSLAPADMPTDLNAPLPCGLTPSEFATTCKSKASVRWLFERGFAPSVIGLWEMGWKSEAKRQLKLNPAMVNQVRGQWKTTPLHDACFRNDTELANLCLSYNPDLTIKDSGFDSTPLGWATHFNRTEIIALIEAKSK